MPVAAMRETDRLEVYAASMLGWLATMTHPDGQIAFFNDAAFGIAALTYFLLRLSGAR